ncbi:MAG: DUF2169 domain-containing protein [Polyangiaceae bacterium]|nr:DUF2169 domain-containing protein [Polyangiaceae bacterium]
MTSAPSEPRIAVTGPVSTGWVAWRSRGQLYLTVVAKARFAFVHGRPMELLEPDDLVTTELHHRDNPSRTVRATSDLSPYLSRVDVVMTGHACAPRGTSVELLPVRLAIFGDKPILDKTLHARASREGGAVKPFDTMPLMYERAVGGIGWDHNPFGVGARAGSPPDPAAANIVYPSDPTLTAGFGPISRSWPHRRKLLGKLARKALDERIIDLPDTFEWAYFQAAPADQQVERLRGNEWVLVSGIHPDLPEISSRLPDARATGLLTPHRGGPARALDFHADTLKIDGDAQSCSLVWRSVIPLANEAAIADLDLTIGIEVLGQAIEWEEPQSADIAESDIVDESTTALPEDSIDLDNEATRVRDGDAPPIRKGEEKTTTLPPDLILGLRKDAAKSAESRHEGTVALSPEEAEFAAHKPETPFAKIPAPPRPAGKPKAQSIEDKHARTVALGPEESAAISKKPETPFGPGRPAAPRPRPAGATQGTPWSRETLAKKPLPSRPSDQTYILDDGEPSPAGPSAPQPPLPQRPPAPVVEQPPASTLPTPGLPRPNLPKPDLPKAGGAPLPKPPAPAKRAPGETSKLSAFPVPKRPQDTVPFVHQTGLTPFTQTWQLKPGRNSLAVMIKATCDIDPDGTVVIRPYADPPAGDVHFEGDPHRTVTYPSDFAIFKPKADILLTGHAYPPGGSSTASQVRFRFGHKKNSFDRRAAVFGERHWQKAGVRLSPGETKPFKKIPLLYERAFGGPGFDDNPVGLGHAGDLLPQIEDPAHLVKSPGDTPKPLGFAGLAPQWPARWRKIGTYDAVWKKTRWPYFPDDFDWTATQAAPREQQLDYLVGDEPFEIEGVHPRHPALVGKLPGLQPRCFAQKTTESGGEFVEVLLRLDTVTFDTDALTVSLVWRGLIDVRDDQASDIAELYLMTESAAGPHADRVEAHSKYVAEKAPTMAAGAALGQAPANDATPSTSPSAEESRRREQLTSAGLTPASAPETAAGASPTHSPPPAPPRQRTPQESQALRASLQTQLSGGGPLTDTDLTGTDLSGFDFSGQTLKGVHFTGTRLVGCKFAACNLAKARFDDANLTGATFTGADLTGADFTRAELERATFERATITETCFQNVRAEGARFVGATGERPSFLEASLKKATFAQASLESADFTKADLDRATFDAAKLKAVRLYEARGSAVSFKEAVLEGARADGAKLVRCLFQQARAPESMWDGAVLDESTFLGAVLTSATLTKASCRKTIFSGADLTSARLQKSVFAGASFLKSNLMEASIEAADLTGADLRGANLHGAETWKSKLGGAKLDLAIVTQTKLAETP